MTYSEEIKKIRQKCFLSQEAFGRELGVSFSSINRWEGGKSKPNMSAMKKLWSSAKHITSTSVR